MRLFRYKGSEQIASKLQSRTFQANFPATFPGLRPSITPFKLSTLILDDFFGRHRKCFACLLLCYHCYVCHAVWFSVAMPMHGAGVKDVVWNL
jgi:hypothetical protein